QIYTLRQLLYDGRNQIIQTLPRRGYLFNPQYLHHEASTTQAQPPTPAPKQPAEAERPALQATTAVHPTPLKRSGSSRTMAWLASIALVLLTGLGLLGTQLAKLSEEPFFTQQRQIGGL